jgi:two-component system sensor histidine kinase YesM
MRRKYFIRKLITYLVAMTLPILLLGMSFFFYTATSLRSDIDIRSRNISDLGGKQLEMILNTTSDLNVLFSNNPALTLVLSKILNAQKLNYAESNYQNIISSILNSTTNSRRFIDSIYLYQNNSLGNYFRTGSMMVNIKDSYDTQWLRIYQTSSVNENLWIVKRTTKYYKFETSREVISIFQRLSNTQGVIVLNLRPDELTHSLDALQMYESESILVIDSNRMLLFNNSNADGMKFDPGVGLDQQFARKTSLDNQKGMFHVEYNGRKYLMTDVPSNKYGLHFISLVPEKEVYSLLRQILLFVGIALLVAFCISFILSYTLTRKSFHQIDVILETLKDAENGVYNTKEPAYFRDEYDTILNNILGTFIRNSYLSLQLNELELREKTAELIALQLQINPHFLFNTLQAIDLEILKNTRTPTPANTLIENLSDILKYSLGNPDHIVSLREEIQNSKKYLQIMTFRNPNMFMAFWEYDEDILDTPVMRLIFQPLIENCIYHGIKPMQEKGLLRIRIIKRRNGLHIRVTDNGSGIPRPVLEQLRSEINQSNFNERHIGLQNTNKRLILSYGPKSALRINSKPGLGTVISFFIPADPDIKPQE